MADEVQQRQVARNESSVRDVNEAIEQGRWPGEERAPASFRCECGMLGCNTLIELSAEDYERVRARSRWFVIAPGHELPSSESVVEEREGYFVVEKRGEAGRVAEANDPRS